MDDTGKPFLVFGAPTIEEAAIQEVVDSLRSGWIGTGPKVARFEEGVRERAGARFAVAMNSCTAAMHLSLRVAGIGPGDEVIVPSMTFCATANAVLHAGAKPVLVDCDPQTHCIDPARVEDAIGERTRAIVPVHLAGRPCDMDSILEIARRRELRVVEDASHALESEYHGRKIGSLGDFSCFSFYVNKNLTTAEGGMVTTNDAHFDERLRLLRLHGQSRDAWDRFGASEPIHYEVSAPGFKCNMTDLQAALGLHQLGRIDAWLERRREIWERYGEAFADLPIELPAEPEANTLHARHLYRVGVTKTRAGIDRDDFVRGLHAGGIGTGIHYVAVHLQPYYRKSFGFRPEDFPHSARISEETLSLPISPALSEADVERVVGSVHEVLGRSG